MVFSLVFNDIIRRTPSKLLILFFCYIIVGHISPRIKVLKELKNYSFKETDLKRSYCMMETLNIIKKH